MHHQARQGQARTQFEYALSGDIHGQHGVRQYLARRPDLAEQRPALGRNPQVLREQVGVVILLKIEQ
ncbi:hypothetical protein D3C85_1786780 [compost metagenome]